MQRPTTEVTLQNKLGIVISKWEKIYNLAREVSLDNYSRIFHFKTSHNLLFLNNSLFRSGLPSTSMCSFCESEEETIYHLFYECRTATLLWSQITAYFADKIDIPSLTPRSAFFGFYEQNADRIIINQIHLTFRMVLYRNRTQGFCNLLIFLGRLRLTKTIEYVIASKCERKRVLNAFKWGILNLS